MPASPFGSTLPFNASALPAANKMGAGGPMFNAGTPAASPFGAGAGAGNKMAAPMGGSFNAPGGGGGMGMNASPLLATNNKPPGNSMFNAGGNAGAGGMQVPFAGNQGNQGNQAFQFAGGQQPKFGPQGGMGGMGGANAFQSSPQFGAATHGFGAAGSNNSSNPQMNMYVRMGRPFLCSSFPSYTKRLIFAPCSMSGGGGGGGGMMSPASPMSAGQSSFAKGSKAKPRGKK
jgi:hypothetical protein